ncbi:hypothetical protein [Bosea sp. BK604]|uniref:hypothetical protein n=1 Tax=Bosea sp. BK604 TaxID=2512180 RepID=UPI00104A40B5|nr:hypothetical protein [Bosea sp. BK604]TCR67412.1 hypothetical protein EV560_103472 [Bosea sp. BK604]
MLRQMILVSASAFALAGLSASPTLALTMKECSVKYQEARKNNTLKGQKWNDFRKAQCGDDDASEADAASAVSEPATPATPAAAPAAPSAPARAGAATTAAAPATPARPAAAPAGRARAAVFPRAVAEKYSSESPGKARLKTCADQYNANKEKNANGELKWIEKGGGYWSQCNAKLKS